MLGSKSISAEVSYPGPGQKIARMRSNAFHRQKTKTSCLLCPFFTSVAIMLEDRLSEMVLFVTHRDWATGI